MISAPTRYMKNIPRSRESLSGGAVLGSTYRTSDHRIFSPAFLKRSILFHTHSSFGRMCS